MNELIIPLSMLPLTGIINCSALTDSREEKSDFPNIVIFLSDDKGYGDFSITGNTNLHTPNIDQMASRGALLTNFYVSPVCSPTRAEFLTGRYHLRSLFSGTSTGNERFNLDETTIADVFKAGYKSLYRLTFGSENLYLDNPDKLKSLQEILEVAKETPDRM